VSFPAPNFVFWSYAVSKNTQKAALGLLFAFSGFYFRPVLPMATCQPPVRIFVPLPRLQQLR
ncbi:hypothetical protein, partial [Pseudomonas fragi]|uniref:hypothetical protein n=1 Tax=Pseudomonas fragi TaxID=296 RepID=UPI001F36C5C2